MDTGITTLDADKLDFVGQTSAVEVYLADIQGSRHGNGLGQKLALGSCDGPDVLQKELYPLVQGRDFGEGFP